MKTLNRITELKSIINLSNELDIDKNELLENLESETSDFEVDNYRFILESEAENILIDMYQGDEYILGCFNAWFIADNCDIEIEVIEALQEADKYDVLGRLMLKKGIDNLISEYVRLDGHGHAFNSYDGNSEEINILGNDYIYFRVN